MKVLSAAHPDPVHVALVVVSMQDRNCGLGEAPLSRLNLVKRYRLSNATTWLPDMVPWVAFSALVVAT